VSEAYIGQIVKGQKVKFVVDAWPDSFPGEVVQVRNSPITEENVVNYDVIIAVNNPDLKLKPGMTATVQVVTGERTGVLRLSNGAFRFKPAAKPAPGAVPPSGPPAATPPPGDGAANRKLDKPPTDEKTVYLKPKNPTDEPVPQKVKTGLNDGVQTEIVAGLKEGDEVILLLKPKADEGGVATNPFGGMGRR